MNKTVYVLGAGFSIGANAPSQADIIKKIFETHERYPDVFRDKKAIGSFKNFLSKTLCIPEHLYHEVPLEDVFTPLDKCIADNISFRNLDTDKVRKMKETVNYLIGQTLEFLLRGSYTDYINLFAKYLVKESARRLDGKFNRQDPVSVISTNWDILLDNSIKDVIDTCYKNKAVVDYCCHISSYDKGDHSVKPGLEMLGKGGFNVKILKIHGSLNWLQCPKCLRLYVNFYNKIAVEQYEDKVTCRHCNKNFGKLQSHRLLPNLIMPTYLKDLSNPQFKLIWQNAGIELAEANKIVFIGYSLPIADFELRQLLSRMVRSDAVIEVVGYGREGEPEVESLMKRYKVFFGNRIAGFHLKGAAEYIFDNFNNYNCINS